MAIARFLKLDQPVKAAGPARWAGPPRPGRWTAGIQRFSKDERRVHGQRVQGRRAGTIRRVFWAGMGSGGFALDVRRAHCPIKTGGDQLFGCL